MILLSMDLLSCSFVVFGNTFLNKSKKSNCNHCLHLYMLSCNLYACYLFPILLKLWTLGYLYLNVCIVTESKLFMFSSIASYHAMSQYLSFLFADCLVFGLLLYLYKFSCCSVCLSFSIYIHFLKWLVLPHPPKILLYTGHCHC